MQGRSASLVLALASLAGVARGDDPPPAARWEFGAEETTPLRSHGGVHRDVPGPRPPEFPDFEPGNIAVRLDGAEDSRDVCRSIRPPAVGRRVGGLH